MTKLQIAVSVVLCVLFACGGMVAGREMPAVVKPTASAVAVDPASLVKGAPATLDMPFIAADVSHTLEPFYYLQGLSDAHIGFFGAEKLFWDEFEPSESSGYQWDAYDDVIREIEARGGDILPTIWSISTWATEVPSSASPSSAPRAEYRQQYSDLIYAFMERYDHDGADDDMPGLVYAHNYLQIEDEAENLGDAWIDSAACDVHPDESEARFRCAADEYGEMLELAYQAAHAANPDAQVVSFSFNFGDYFDDNPASFPSISPKAQYRLAFLDQVFVHYTGLRYIA